MAKATPKAKKNTPRFGPLAIAQILFLRSQGKTFRAIAKAPFVRCATGGPSGLAHDQYAGGPLRYAVKKGFVRACRGYPAGAALQVDKTGILSAGARRHTMQVAATGPCRAQSVGGTKTIEMSLTGS